jgi:hypothetical protein
MEQGIEAALMEDLVSIGFIDDMEIVNLSIRSNNVFVLASTFCL